MKHTFTILLTVALTACFSLSADAQNPAAYGKWTETNGETFVGTFIKLEGNIVHIRLDDVPPSGDPIAIVPLNQLHENNRKHITEELIGGKLFELAIKGIKYRFRRCPAGSFTMGSLPAEPNRNNNETAHQVTLSKGFWIQETEVTQEQWESINGDNPSSSQGAKLPVENVSWDDCQKFIETLNKHTSGGHSPAGLPAGYKFALPTEAQWEFACRGGTTGAYAGNLDNMAWYSRNSGAKTHDVGTKTPNAWNIYDMHGNVWEWCQDWYGEYAAAAVVNPTGAVPGLWRVNRGGAYASAAGDCRSAFRSNTKPENRSKFLGLRLALVRGDR